MRLTEVYITYIIVIVATKQTLTQTGGMREWEKAEWKKLNMKDC